jgi:hypothetical protein
MSEKIEEDSLFYEYDLFSPLLLEQNQNNGSQEDSKDGDETKNSSLPPLPTAKVLARIAYSFLLSMGVQAAHPAVSIPSGHGRYPAGFFSLGSSKKNPINRTVVALASTDPELFFPNCQDAKGCLEEIRQLEVKKAMLEVLIQQEQPELASTDDLFGEFVNWDYASCNNPEYHEILKRLKQAQTRLEHGSNLGKISSSEAVDAGYLILPGVTGVPKGVAPEWGVVGFANGVFTVLRESAFREKAHNDKKILLARNVAIAQASETRFAWGIEFQDGQLKYRQMPRRRKFDDYWGV